MKTKLRLACENSYGYFDATPGTDLRRRLNTSQSTINSYIKRGYLRVVGSGLVLTQKGYNYA